MNRFGGFSRALLVRKTTSVQFKSMCTGNAVAKNGVKKELTAAQIEADRVDNLDPAELWMYKER